MRLRYVWPTVSFDEELYIALARCAASKSTVKRPNQECLNFELYPTKEEWDVIADPHTPWSVKYATMKKKHSHTSEHLHNVTPEANPKPYPKTLAVPLCGRKNP